MSRMNEQGRSETLAEVFAGSDTANVESMIGSMYLSAWRKATKMLPRSYFNQAELPRGPLWHYYDVHKGTGCLLLPEDFYVPVIFQMRGWQKPVLQAVEETDEVAAVQANEYVRGNKVFPVCTLCDYAPIYEGMPATDRRRMLKYYSVERNRAHHIDYGRYIALPEDLAAEEDSFEMHLNEPLYEPLGWIHAGVVFTVFEKHDQAKACDEKAVHVL